MKVKNRLPLKIAVAALVVATGIVTLLGQSPTPVGGQRGAQQGQRGGQGQQQPSNLPANPVVTPLPAISAEVTGPGRMLPALMTLRSGDDMAHFKYEAKEYFVSGAANGQPYKTRIVVRKPSDNSRFSGLVLAESMHPSGNAWMFHFTHTYTMASGHIGLEIVTSDPAQFVEYSPERYRDLKITQGQAPEIIAQVGALMKSSRQDNPLAGLPLRKMILAGTSASAGTLVQYLPSHMVYRLPDMKPVYDGFLPTSNGANIRQIDVPMIQVPTMTEVMNGNATTRQDGDASGDQFRVYEFAGMPHLDSREAEAYTPDPCKNPITKFPLGAYMSVALDHLFKWVDKGAVPPRADRILVDRNAANDGSLMALDEYGNPRGGIRNPYVDFPVKKYGVPNTAAVPPIPNAHPFIAVRGPGGAEQLCRLAGYDLALSQEQLKKLYKNKKDYQGKVEQRLNELTKQGWSLPVYKDLILGDAAKVSF